MSGPRIGFKSLKEAWADTTTAHGRLMLTVLGGLAEFERELIMARTGEGRKAGARARCQVWPPAEADATSQADIARSYAVDATRIGIGRLQA
jgi:DNA invertase Pin-like site-specific DNA recombinase